MLFVLPLIILGVLSPAAQGWSYHASCEGISNELTAGMNAAFTRAREASTELRKTPREKHIDALVKLLFGSDNDKITDAGNRLGDIPALDVFRTQPIPYDVLIYCSTDRITDWFNQTTHLRIGYHDPDRGPQGSNVRGFVRMDDCRSDNHQGDASVRALTINIGRSKNEKGEILIEKYPDTIQLCPWYLQQIAGPPIRYDTPLPTDVIKKAADMKAPGLLSRLDAKLFGITLATPIDSLHGFVNVLLHEMTHAATAGYSDDIPPNKCYGWLNCAQCQQSQNADSLAYFALAVELVLHNGYTVNKDGSLQKLK